MWIKYWTVGNGGLSGHVEIAQIPDNSNEEYIKDYIEEMAGCQSSGYRGSKYKVIEPDEIPPSYFEDEIIRRDKAIQAAWERLKEVPKLRKMQKASELRLKRLKKLKLGDVLGTKWDYSGEQNDFFKPLINGWLSLYKRGKKIEASLTVKGLEKETIFKPEDTVSDLIRWSKA